MTIDDYADRPCPPELLAIVLVGMLHIATELLTSDATARAFNAVVSVLFLGYLVVRARRSPGALRAWGMRADNFGPAMRAQLVFGAIGTVALVGFGIATDSLVLPATFWLTLGLYPIWGVAQQFALQSLIGRNLTGWLSSRWSIALVASALFAIAHAPNWPLVVLTGIAGVPLTLVYRRIPNLWAVGIVHGLLGSLAVYIVLQQDPGRALWAWVSSSLPK